MNWSNRAKKWLDSHDVITINESSEEPTAITATFCHKSSYYFYQVANLIPRHHHGAPNRLNDTKVYHIRPIWSPLTIMCVNLCAPLIPLDKKLIT